jgi:hypothetical protein
MMSLLEEVSTFFCIFNSVGRIIGSIPNSGLGLNRSLNVFPLHADGRKLHFHSTQTVEQTLSICTSFAAIKKSKEAGIRTLVALDDQGGEL